MESGEKLQDIEAHQGAILSCRASPDRCLFATTSADRTAKVQHLLTHIVTGREVSVCGACNNLTYYTSSVRTHYVQHMQMNVLPYMIDEAKSSFCCQSLEKMALLYLLFYSRWLWTW